MEGLPHYHQKKRATSYRTFKRLSASHEAVQGSTERHMHAIGLLQRSIGRIRRRLCRSRAVVVLLLISVLTVTAVSAVNISSTFLAAQEAREGKLVLGKLNLLTWLAISVALVLLPTVSVATDMSIGRRRVVSLSVWVLFVACVWGTITFVLYISFAQHHIEMTITFWVIFALLVILGSVVLFEANVVQFAVDQLEDASSDQLSSFVHWYVWTRSLGKGGFIILLLVAYRFTTQAKAANAVLSCLVVLVCSTIAFIFFLQLCMKHRFAVTITGQHHTLRLLARVVCFAFRHKYPARTSSISVDGELPSRIDLAKSLHGGTCSNQEVEDVKTFFQIVKVLATLIPVFSLLCTRFVTGNAMFYHMAIGPNISDILQQVLYQQYSFLQILTTSSPLLGIVLVPIHEFILYPLFGMVFRRSLFKLFVGHIFQIMSLLSILAIQAAAFVRERKSICIFESLNATSFDQYNSTSPLYLIIPATFDGLAYVLVNTSAIEFILAQAPRTFRAVAVTSFYCIKGMSVTIGLIVILPFLTDTRSLPKTYPCGLLYYGANLLVGLCGVAVFSLVGRGYKYRQRTDAGTSVSLGPASVAGINL